MFSSSERSSFSASHVANRNRVEVALRAGENRDHQLRPGMNVVPDVYLK